MKVFLSWSGPVSKGVAEALLKWLPDVIQAIDPWMSSEIDKGARWAHDLAAQLEVTKAGIICVTPDNQDAPWLNFEAGAISKAVESTLTCPYLFGLSATDLKGPLVQFQACLSNKADTYRLVQTLNKALGDKALRDRLLGASFERCWPEMEEILGAISMETPSAGTNRPPEEFLEEILSLAREQAKRSSYVDQRIDVLVQNTTKRMSDFYPTLMPLTSMYDPPVDPTPRLTALGKLSGFSTEPIKMSSQVFSAVSLSGEPTSSASESIEHPNPDDDAEVPTVK